MSRADGMLIALMFVFGGCASHDVEAPTASEMMDTLGEESCGAEGPQSNSAPQPQTPPASTGASQQASEPKGCGVPGTVIKLSTATELRTRMVGRWLYCSGVKIFAQQHDGIQLKDDGTWAFLRYDAERRLQPQGGFDGGGNWTMIDTQAFNGAGSFQVNLDTSRGGNGAFMSFQENPSAMRMSTTGGITDYVAASADD